MSETDPFVDGCLAIAEERDPARMAALAARIAAEVLGAPRAAVRLADGAAAVGFAEPPPSPAAVEGALVAPIGDGGWLCADGKPGGFDAADERRLRALAAQVAVASDRARLAREARATQSLYRTLVEQLPAVTYYRELDAPGSPWFVSPQIEALLGFPHAELMADPNAWQKHLHPDDRERVLAEQRSYRPADARQPLRAEYRMVRSDGRVVWVQNFALAVRDDEGRPRFVMGLLFDVTDMRRAEEQLRHAQKMDAVGRLAGGIAHDFNNLLSVILCSCMLALDELPEGRLRDDLREVVKAGELARDLTRQLLAFSRQQVLQPTVLDLGRVVTGMESMLRRLLGEDVALVLEVAPRLAPVRADRSQIEQVLLNLAVNARDAMPDGGTLTVAVSNAEADATAREQLGLAAGTHVVLSVRDTGVGMDRATLARVFEPFFTTKGKGRGTGLGLSTVLGIVQQSGGAVAAESEPGRGAVFRVYLPETHAAASSTARQAVPPSLRGSETVLLAEDDEQVRRLVRGILERYGYQVIAAANGAEAVQAAEAHAGPIHLLLTDVIMPGMNGRALAERMARARPEARIVFMSGYTDDAVLRDGELDFPATIVQKPVTPNELGRVLRAVLDEKR